jgi:hypothetical protein
MEKDSRSINKFSVTRGGEKESRTGPAILTCKSHVPLATSTHNFSSTGLWRGKKSLGPMPKTKTLGEASRIKI